MTSPTPAPTWPPVAVEQRRGDEELPPCHRSRVRPPCDRPAGWRVILGDPADQTPLVWDSCERCLPMVIDTARRTEPTSTHPLPGVDPDFPLGLALPRSMWDAFVTVIGGVELTGAGNSVLRMGRLFEARDDDPPGWVNTGNARLNPAEREALISALVGHRAATGIPGQSLYADDPSQELLATIRDAETHGATVIETPTGPVVFFSALQLAAWKAALLHRLASDEFAARAAADPVKEDLELVHAPCGTVICDIQHGDPMRVLLNCCAGHACPPEVPALDTEDGPR